MIEWPLGAIGVLAFVVFGEARHRARAAMLGSLPVLFGAVLSISGGHADARTGFRWGSVDPAMFWIVGFLLLGFFLYLWRSTRTYGARCIIASFLLTLGSVAGYLAGNRWGSFLGFAN